MYRKTILLLILVLIIIVVTACGGEEKSTPTVDVQGTVDASIYSTGTAQAGVQATIEAAILETSTAVAPPPTDAAVVTPTPSVEYVTMTEEELAALIDQAVAEAIEASEQSATQTTTATADDTLTQEELDELAYYYALTEEAIAYADELIYAYYGIYGELAMETIELLEAIEEDLSALASEAVAMNAMLLEAANTLEQGLELTEGTIAQIESTAEIITGKATEVQTRNQEWVENLQVEMEKRAEMALAVKPDNVATDRKGAILSAFGFADLVSQSLADHKLSFSELSKIAQLGANASASLSAFGGPQLQGLAGSINQITGQLARGQVPHAQASLGNLTGALGSRPSLR